MIKKVIYITKTTYKIIWFINLLVFFISILSNFRKIIRSKTIMSLDFIVPINVKYQKNKYQIRHYYELLFLMWWYEHIIDNVENNMLFLDIWAHFWEASYKFLNISKGWYAILFEPNPNNIKIMKNFFEQNKIKKYMIYEIWLWNETWKKAFYFDNTLAYTGNFWLWWKNKIITKIEKMDNLNIKNIISKYNKIFLKIDVEWFEIETLKWMEKTLKNMILQKKKIKLIIEINDKRNFDPVFSIMKKINKNIIYKKITPRDFLFIFK